MVAFPGSFPFTSHLLGGVGLAAMVRYRDRVPGGDFCCIVAAAGLLRSAWLESQRMRRLDAAGRAVLITGCDTGFGHLLALRLTEDEGRLGSFTKVFAGCFTKEGVASLTSLRRSRLEAILLDVTNDISVNEIAARVEQVCTAEGLTFWGLVNNAGVTSGSIFDLSTVADFERCIAVNYIGVVRMTKAVIHLLRRARGRIVNIVSYAGYMAAPTASPYMASKHAADVVSRAMTWELESPWGMRIVTVCPGTHGTPLLDNMVGSVLGESARARSPKSFDLYGEHFVAGLQDLMSRGVKTSSRADPGNVSRVMEEALLSRRPASRYIVGYDAQMWRFFASLPWAAQDACFSQVMRMLPAPVGMS